MDASKLQSWLPLLQHPVHGEAICDVAGWHLERLDGDYWNSSASGDRSKATLYPHEVSALALGTLAVMGSCGTEVTLEKVNRTWWVERAGQRNTPFIGVQGDTPATAILAAAYRWLGIGGDS